MLVRFNSITDNSQWGILNETAEEVIAFCNWYGDERGPSGEGSGNGDAVSVKVLFYPWSVNEYMNLCSDAEHEIIISVNLETGGTVQGGGIYTHFDEATVSAEANEGYVFINWTEDGIEVSTDATDTFIVTGNRNLVANFNDAALYPEEEQIGDLPATGVSIYIGLNILGLILFLAGILIPLCRNTPDSLSS